MKITQIAYLFFVSVTILTRENIHLNQKSGKDQTTLIHFVWGTVANKEKESFPGQIMVNCKLYHFLPFCQILITTCSITIQMTAKVQCSTKNNSTLYFDSNILNAMSNWKPNIVL